MFKAVLSDEVGIIKVRGVPFGGPNKKDAHGQWFSDRTNFLPHILPYPPVFHFHGSKTGSMAKEVGSTLSREQLPDGVWYKIKLAINHADEAIRTKAAELWEAAKAGKLYASSGAVEATIITDPSGEILQWLVGEISLLNTDKPQERPASFHAIAAPVSVKMDNIDTGNLTLGDLDIIGDEESDNSNSSTTPPQLPPGGETEFDEVIDLTSITGHISTYIENIYHSIRNLFPGDDRVKNVMLDTYNEMFDSPLSPNILRSNVKMEVNDKDTLELLQRQMAETAAQVATLQQTIATKDATIADLQSQVSTKSAQVEMSRHESLVDAWIKEGKLTPAERPFALDLLSLSFKADIAAKAQGDNSLVEILKKWISAKSVTPILNPAGVYTNLNGNGIINTPGGEIDPRNVERLKRYADL